jgi:very-short-patch-repair endonuclease
MRKRSPHGRSADDIITALAARQHGVVSRAQLLGAGVSVKVIDGRLAGGQLSALHRGVYQVGPIVAAHAREMAAHLACGPGSVVSHKSAAVLWQLLPAPARAQPVDILVRARKRRRPGIVARRGRPLQSNDVTKLYGIPLTTAARTIVDLAACVSGRELEQAVAQSLARRLTTRAQLERLLARARGRRGGGRLRALLHGQAALTRSEAEERLLALIRKARLPEPATNARIAGFEVDFLWRTERLVVEVDGYAFHADATRFEKDRQRDFALTSTGLRVVRVTWKQLVHEPEVILVRLAQSLVQR